MSSKSHFIFEHGIEGFEETNEPQSVFGKLVGFNAYLYIDQAILKSVKIKGDYLYIKTKTDHLPPTIKVWGDAVIEADIDRDGLMLALKGGHVVTKKIINLDFQTQ